MLNIKVITKADVPINFRVKSLPFNYLTVVKH